MGSMLCGRTREKNLDHPDFFPMFESAARQPIAWKKGLPPMAIPAKTRDAKRVS
jgi:hypothetical protein